MIHQEGKNCGSEDEKIRILEDSRYYSISNKIFSLEKEKTLESLWVSNIDASYFSNMLIKNHSEA